MQESEFNSWLLSARERYNSAKKFIESSKDDDPKDPYRSKYKAKDVLSSLLSDVERWKSSENVYIVVLHALFQYELGVIACETEENSLGCDLLTSSWEEIKDCSLKSECCLLSLSILNQLGILWSGRTETSKALTYLLEGEKLYNQYKENNQISPYSFEDIFEARDIEKNEWLPLEKTFTLTLYYLAQVYEHLNESEKSAKYCHETLKRQRFYNEFEPLEWAVNCATLSQYYIQEKMFDVAKHLLACASDTLKIYESTLGENDEEDIRDELRRSKAEVAWCSLKYCINLLSEKDSTLDDREELNINQSYRLYDNENVLALESQIPSKISNFEDAKCVFKYGQNQVTEAKVYYTLNYHANNHVQLIQDHSKLYKNLILYEEDLRNQCKMHKRRIDMLESVLTKLNPQYYLSVCRQIMFELGETYYELTNLKFKVAGLNSGNLTPEATKKINKLIVLGSDHFQSFIDSLKSPDGSLPTVFSDDLVRPAIVANFYIGGLYSKYIEPDAVKRLHNLKKCENHYKFIIDYVKNNPSQANCVEQELAVAEEMIKMVPGRVTQIANAAVLGID